MTATPLAVVSVAGSAVIGLAVAFMQAAAGGVQVDPIVTMMGAAIAALFTALMWALRGRTERCEKREDKLLEQDGEKTTALKELAAVTSKGVDLATRSVDTATTSIDETKSNGRKLDALRQDMGALTQDMTGIKAALDRLSYDPPNSPPSARRRSTP